MQHTFIHTKKERMERGREGGRGEGEKGRKEERKRERRGSLKEFVHYKALGTFTVTANKLED